MVRKRKKPMNEGLRLAVEAAGTRYRLAKLLGIWPSSVLRWRDIPAERVIEVERVTGIGRERLRPDLYARSDV
jgi:DNA-binding transcriptional regulator YdaS (Cro superfamily)